MRSPALVIMAAGLGSRFGGGIKQLEPVGPCGEIIMDYSVYDALEAGFDKVVFIIRRDLEEDFRRIIGTRIEKIADVAYAFQELDALPEGYRVPKDRKKPWGTGQAVLSAKGMIKEPFVVINADDYYGKEAFRNIHHYMTEEMETETSVYDMCMAGFILSNTLSANGTVTRGICQLNPDHTLKTVTETYDIEMKRQKLFANDSKGNPVKISPDQPVSMNMWGFPPSFLDELEQGFPRFLDQIQPGDVKTEYLLPQIVDDLIRQGKARVQVLETRDKWFGVTYREDKEAVMASIHELIKAGAYSEHLYS